MNINVVALWRRLPVLVRALIVAFVVLNIGTTATVLPLIGNVKFHPEIPWAFPATLAILAVFWWYFTGGGWPSSTRELRRDVTRRQILSWPVWRVSLLAIALSVMAVASFRLLLPSILPVDAPTIPLDLTPIPMVTIVGLLASLVVSAAVAEEVAFRGYLQKPLEDAYGIVAALVVTGVGFWFAHIDKVSLSHLPFHMLSSILLGLSAYLTRSLLPAIVGHALGDALLQPAYVFHQPAFVWAALNAKPVWNHANAQTWGEKAVIVFQAVGPSHLLQPGPSQTTAVLFWVFVVSLALSTLALFVLARVTRQERKAPV